MKKNEIIKRYSVCGAGDFIISQLPTHWTGNAAGYHIGVTWGKHGESGGVMDWKEALQLAIQILITLPRVIITIQRRNKYFK